MTMYRPISRLIAILLAAGSIGVASAEPSTQTLPDNGPSGMQAGPDADTAKRVLDDRQKAVEDIRYGRAAPYYLFPPPAGGGSSSPSKADTNKK